jgi:hypothetical protein
VCVVAQYTRLGVDVSDPDTERICNNWDGERSGRGREYIYEYILDGYARSNSQSYKSTSEVGVAEYRN